MVKNRGVYGFKNLHVGTYTVGDGGTVTLGTPYRQAGAVGFSPDQDSDTNNAYADDTVWWSNISEGAISGDLIVMNYDDEFKTQFAGWAANTNGGIGPVKGANKPNIYAAFEVTGSSENRRVIFYNGTTGPIKREYGTVEEAPEPATESMPVNFIGDNATGKYYDVFKPGDDGYDTLFTAPTAPVLVP